MRKRNNTAAIYFNDTEWNDLHERMKQTGLNLQVYVRKSVFGEKITPIPCDHHDDLLRALTSISNNSEEQIRKLRDQGSLADDQIKELWDTIYRTWDLISGRY